MNDVRFGVKDVKLQSIWDLRLSKDLNYSVMVGYSLSSFLNSLSMN